MLARNLKAFELSRSFRDINQHIDVYCGALIFLNLRVATINIYAQTGLVTLIDLISKHSVFMVEFANRLQEKEGLLIQKAIEKVATIRLRPILMTAAANGIMLNN